MANEEMADPAQIAQLHQLVGQLNALQQTIRNLQASNTTLTTRIATLEARSRVAEWLGGAESSKGARV